MSKVTLALTALVLVVGCSGAPATPTAEPTPEVEAVMIRTAQPPRPGETQACMMALAEGILVVDPRSGLALRGGDRVTPVVWPALYSAARIDGVITLLDENRRPVAREGDRVQVGGGLGTGDFWYACAGIEVMR